MPHRAKLRLLTTNDDNIYSAMPGQRDKKRRSLSAYLWENEKEVLKRVAKENDMTLTELVEYLVDELEKKSDTITRENIKKWKKK